MGVGSHGLAVATAMFAGNQGGLPTSARTMLGGIRKLTLALSYPIRLLASEPWLGATAFALLVALVVWAASSDGALLGATLPALTLLAVILGLALLDRRHVRLRGVESELRAHDRLQRHARCPGRVRHPGPRSQLGRRARPRRVAGRAGPARRARGPHVGLHCVGRGSGRSRTDARGAHQSAAHSSVAAPCSASTAGRWSGRSPPSPPDSSIDVLSSTARAI